MRVCAQATAAELRHGLASCGTVPEPACVAVLGIVHQEDMRDRVASRVIDVSAFAAA